ncbi:uncharacterized protein PG986_002508 [Apiospora aurea]|uniref:Uncharacterized protein n=1 Tax=Apiospora aurea TaxID=335848 RepID=A0ABR1QP11_9PEZI
MLNLAQTCKGFSGDVVETLYRQHRSSAILWACTRDKVSPLMNCVRFNIPLDQHLDVSRYRRSSYNFAPTAPVILSKPTPLILALASSRLRAAEFLIEQGAASSRWYPIHFAVLLTQSPEREDDALRILKKLLDHGASANQKTLEARPLAIPRTPLAQVMPSTAPLEAMDLLLKHGADPLTMLAWVGRGHRATRLLDILLQSGARQRRAAGSRGTGLLMAKCTSLLLQMPCNYTFSRLLESMVTELSLLQVSHILRKIGEMEMQAASDSSRAATCEVGTGTSSD